MKKTAFFVAVLAMIYGAGTVWAAAPLPTNVPAPPASMQEKKMKACEAEFQQKKIDASQRKLFVSQCMKRASTVGKF